jgi:hypothetical protein
VLAAGHQLVLWRQEADGGIRGRALALAQGVDSGSEEETSGDEEEVDQEQREEGDVPFNQKTSGFCNCSLM